MALTLPFILSIPHGGQTVPPEAVDLCALTEEGIFNESDAFTPEIYTMGEAVLGEATQDVARVIVDLNRPRQEMPPQKVDGAVKALTSFGEPVWRSGIPPDQEFMEALLERYYDPYHRRLEALLDARREEVRLFIDCHSMAAVGPPIANDAGKERPLICLSNMGNKVGVSSRLRRTSLPSQVLQKLGRIMADVFAEDIGLLGHGDPILLNTPFQGGYITQHYSSLGFWVIQIELSKDLYLHPQWFEPETRTVDESRIRELNQKLRTAFVELAEHIDKA